MLPSPSFICLEASNKAIPTMDVIKDHHIDHARVFSLCHAADESLDHIFLQCEFANFLWFGLSLSLHMVCLNPMYTVGFRNCYLMCAYFLLKLFILENVWYAWNQILMKGEKIHLLQILF